MVEAKSFEEISRRSERSRVGTVLGLEGSEEGDGERRRNDDDGVSIDGMRTGRETMSGDGKNQGEQSNNYANNGSANAANPLAPHPNNPLTFTITPTIKLTIRPLRLKRYLQSTYKHPLSQ